MPRAIIVYGRHSALSEQLPILSLVASLLNMRVARETRSRHGTQMARVLISSRSSFS